MEGNGRRGNGSRSGKNGPRKQGGGNGKTDKRTFFPSEPHPTTSRLSLLLPPAKEKERGISFSHSETMDWDCVPTYFSSPSSFLSPFFPSHSLRFLDEFPMPILPRPFSPAAPHRDEIQHRIGKTSSEFKALRLGRSPRLRT